MLLRARASTVSKWFIGLTLFYETEIAGERHEHTNGGLAGRVVDVCIVIGHVQTVTKTGGEMGGRLARAPGPTTAARYACCGQDHERHEDHPGPS